MAKVTRNFPTKDSRLDELLDELCARVGDLTLFAVESGSQALLLNSSGTTLFAGLFVGFNAGGQLTLAGGAGGNRAVLFCMSQGMPGKDVKVAQSGLHRVRLEPGTQPTPGGPVWLSASRFGMATARRPGDGAAAQLLGTFLSTAGTDGKALAMLSISLETAERV